MKTFGWVLISGLVLIVIGLAISRKTSGKIGGEEANIQAGALLDRIAKKQAPYLLDVREPQELTGPLRALPGAVNIPLGSLPARFNEVPRNREVVVICRSGNRSRQAYGFLRQQGFTQVRNLEGGMLAVEAQKSR